MPEPATAGAVRSRLLLWVYVALGVWAVTAPYAGPVIGLQVNTLAVVEVVDHVVPGVVVLLVALSGLARGLLPRWGLALIGLAGVWMTGTHAPLLVQATGPGAPMDAAVFHSLPGILIFLVTVAVAVATAADPQPRSAARDPEP